MEPKVEVTRSQLIQIFTEWDRSFYEDGDLGTLNDYLDPALPVQQADSLIEFVNKLQEDK